MYYWQLKVMILHKICATNKNAAFSDMKVLQSDKIHNTTYHIINQSGSEFIKS